MTSSAIDKVQAFICFDANLATLEKCKPNCENREGVLCIHRFEVKADVQNYNTGKFHGWSDLRIFLYFLANILISIAEDRLELSKCAFLILTKDRNFIDDVEADWLRTKTSKYLDLIFLENSISYGGLSIFVQQIDCRNYGHSRGDDLRCAFDKVNKFLNN